MVMKFFLYRSLADSQPIEHHLHGNGSPRDPTDMHSPITIYTHRERRQFLIINDKNPVKRINHHFERLLP